MSGSTDKRSPLEIRDNLVFTNYAELKTVLSRQTFWLRKRSAELIEIQEEINSKLPSTVGNLEERNDLIHSKQKLMEVHANLEKNNAKAHEAIRLYTAYIRLPEPGPELELPPNNWLDESIQEINNIEHLNIRAPITYPPKLAELVNSL